MSQVTRVGSIEEFFEPRAILSLPHNSTSAYHSMQPRVPFKFRRKSLSAEDDMPQYDFSSRNNSSSPVTSSPMPPTPFASSSPPGYPRIHGSPGIVGVETLREQSDEEDGISTIWGRDYQRYGGPLKSLYAGMAGGLSIHSRTKPSSSSYLDAYQPPGSSVFINRPSSPEETDEERESEEFMNVRQTCFATSSERGRWRSSPIPIKTQSRTLKSTSSPLPRAFLNEKVTKLKPALPPLNITSKLNYCDDRNLVPSTEWRRPSTASSTSTFPQSPITSTLPSRSEEPEHRHKTSSLPPSSPPISPMFIAQSLPDVDDSEIDMLVDSDEEDKAQDPASFVVLKISGSETQSEDESESLIPEIATLDFMSACANILPETASPIVEPSVALPTVCSSESPEIIAMPALETTPALLKSISNNNPNESNSAFTDLVKPVVVAKQPTPPTPVKQPLANKKNQPHPGQSTTSTDDVVPTPPATHISLSMPTPIQMDVDVVVLPTDSSLSVVEPLAPTPSLAFSDNAGSAALGRDDIIMEAIPAPLKKWKSQSPLTPIGVASAGPSRPASPSSSGAISRKGSPSLLPKSVLVNTKNPVSDTTSGQVLEPMPQHRPGDKTVTAKKSKGSDIPHGEKAKIVKAKKPEGGREQSKTVVESCQPPKTAKTNSEAGPSKQRLVADKASSKLPPATGNDKAEPAKRKQKAEERSEGPARKKPRVLKELSVPADSKCANAIDESPENAKVSTGRKPNKSEPLTSKAKAKKSKSADLDPNSDSDAPLLDLDPARISELQGMLIESFAVSRASSQSASVLYRSVTQNRPSLKTEHTEKQWLQMIEAVLEDGQNRSGVFGKIESSFKDDSDRALEAKWFYVPERDVDQDRAALISSMMPRAAKRTETKKYKQYYYQPLDKISRWDPEDDL